MPTIPRCDLIDASDRPQEVFLGKLEIKNTFYNIPVSSSMTEVGHGCVLCASPGLKSVRTLSEQPHPLLQVNGLRSRLHSTSAICKCPEKDSGRGSGLQEYQPNRIRACNPKHVRVPIKIAPHVWKKLR